MPVQWSRLLGLLPDAQSRSSHLDAGDFGRVVARGRRSAPALFRLRERAGARNRAFVPGPVGCVAMDESHCLNAVRYLALSPVRARLSATPGDWPWSSVRAHLEGRDDALVSDPCWSLRRTSPICWRSRWANSRSWRVLKTAARTGARWATRNSLRLSKASWAGPCVGESPAPNRSRAADAIGDCVSRSRQIPGKSSGDCVSCPRKCPEMCIMSRVALKIGAPRRPNFIYKLKEV